MSTGSSEDDLANWEVVTGDGEEQVDEDGFESDSSIEVVSMEMDEELESSSPHVSLPSGSPRGPVFVLRVPSRERDDLTTESEESDEGDTNVSRELRVVCHREDISTHSDDTKGTTDSQGVDSKTCRGEVANNIDDDIVLSNSCISISTTGYVPNLHSEDGGTDVQANLEPAVHSEPQKVVEQVEISMLPKEDTEESPSDAEKREELPLPGEEKSMDDLSSDVIKSGDEMKLNEEVGETESKISQVPCGLGQAHDVPLEISPVSENGRGDPELMEPVDIAEIEVDKPSDTEQAHDVQQEIRSLSENGQGNREAVPPVDFEEIQVDKPSEMQQDQDVHPEIPPVNENDQGKQEHMPCVDVEEIEVDKKIHLDILDNKLDPGQLQPSDNEADEEQEVPPEPLEGVDPGNLDRIDNHDEDEADHVEEAGHIEDADSDDDDEVEIQLQGPHVLQNDVMIEQPQPQLFVQDDTETESANEMELEDDRIESDQSDLHTPDSSDLSNVDIGDLILDNHQVLRGYVHQPNGQLNITLNYIVGLVLVVVVGIGIGHSIGSSLKSPEQIAVQQERMSEIYRLRQQISDWHASSAITTEQKRLLKVENEKLILDYQTMREKANLMQNEITELRSEVTKLKYKAHTAVQAKTHPTELRHFEEKKNQLMNVINSLQQERADLITAVVTTRYGQPPGNVEDEKNKDGSQTCMPGVDKPRVDEHTKKVPRNSGRELDQSLRESGNEGPQIKHKKQTTESSPDDKETRRDIFDTLKKELEFMRGRADMWENLYLELKAKNAEKSCPPKDSVSTEDIFRCVGKLIQDYSFSNSTQVLQKNWEEWINQSLSNTGFLAMMDVMSEFTAKVRPGTKEEERKKAEGRQDTSDGHRHGSDKQDQDKWTDTMQDLFNKTKTSVSNVSKQIQDTWKQVKNLSTDFWKKHEPIVSSVKDEMSNKMEKMSQHVKNWLRRSKQKKAHRRYHRYYKEDDDDDDDKDDDDNDDKQKAWKGHHGSTKFGSTKRRQYDTDGKQHRHNSGNRRHKNDRRGDSRKRNKFRKLQNAFKRLNAKKFNRMNCNDVKNIYGRFETIGQIVYIENLDSYDSQWYVCQRKWWYNSVYDIKTPDLSCQNILADWQVSTGSGTKGCLFNNHRHRRHGKMKRRCKHKAHHYENTGYGKQSGYQWEKYDQQWKRNEDYPDPQRKFEGTPDYHPDSEFEFDEISLQEIFSNSSFWDFSEMLYGNFDVNFKKENSWYLEQMKHRQLQREKKEFQDKGRKNSKWLFARAEDREFQRTLPDDWYSRRSKTDIYN